MQDLRLGADTINVNWNNIVATMHESLEDGARLVSLMLPVAQPSNGLDEIIREILLGFL